MLTITKLARKFNLSRTTILYYEREGLLTPSSRNQSGYRQYGEKEIAKLESIISYRSFGLSVQDIIQLMDSHNDREREQVLREQFTALNSEINRLRKQQTAIVAMLKDPSLSRDDIVPKARWQEVMKAAGFNDEDMDNWHKQFEKMEPLGHQKFLESLGIGSDEITKIRAWSKLE